MLRPALVTGPVVLPVSLAEVKLALRVDSDDSDAEIEGLIRAAVAHYEGWSGVLGIILVEQTWRQDFDRFARKIPLALRPAQSISAIRYRDSAGEINTVASSEYALRQEGGGGSCVRFVNGFSTPGDLYEDAPLSIDYVVGWPVVDGVASVPDDIRTAIMLFVQKHYDEAARANWDVLDRVEKALTSKYRPSQV